MIERFRFRSKVTSLMRSYLDANGFLDWHTWAIGIEYVDGKPYIYALMQFFWEP